MTNTITSEHEPPTAHGSWLLGSTMEFLRDPLAMGLRGYHEGGDVVRYVLGVPGLRTELFMVSHPDVVAQILNAPNHQNFRKDSSFYQPVRDLFGNGLLTSQDESWMRQRRFIQPLFTARSVDGYAEAMTEEIDRTVVQWQARPDGVLDLSAEMTRLTLHIVTRILFGHDATQMAPILGSTFPVLTRAVLSRGVSPVSVPLSWPTPANRRIARAQERIHTVCDEIIAARRATGATGTDLIGRLVAARDGSDALSDKEVREQVQIFLFAGHDTTATALTFALCLLGSDRHAQSKVREEADSIANGSSPTAADIHALKYTMMVLKEATRLYPSAPYISRRGVEESEICGYNIPAGADITIAPWVIHHRDDFWPDPFHFDPDRFTPDQEQDRHKFAWLPFGHGPRGCIGQRFAMLEAAVTLATLVREFEFTTPPGDIAVTTDMVLHSVGPVPCHVRRLTRTRPEP